MSSSPSLRDKQAINTRHRHYSALTCALNFIIQFTRSCDTLFLLYQQSVPQQDSATAPTKLPGNGKMAPIPLIESSISSVRHAITDLAASASSISSRSPSSTVRPTRSIVNHLLSLTARQSTPSIIPTTYGNTTNSMAPGTIVGIVLGSVGGFLFLLWLIYTFANLGTPDQSDYTESVVIQDRRRRSSPR